AVCRHVPDAGLCRRRPAAVLGLLAQGDSGRCGPCQRAWLDCRCHPVDRPSHLRRRRPGLAVRLLARGRRGHGGWHRGGPRSGRSGRGPGRDLAAARPPARPRCPHRHLPRADVPARWPGGHRSGRSARLRALGVRRWPMTGLFLINILLALAWGAVTGSFDEVNLLFGFALGALALILIREQVGTGTYFARAGKVLILCAIFLYELVMSAVRVARIVVRPKIELQPGIIAYPLDVDRDFEITMLANLITLTPGTLSVDVSEDRKTLYVHCIDVPDPQATIDDIKRSFECRILEAFR